MAAGRFFRIRIQTMCILYTLHDALNVVNGQYEFRISTLQSLLSILKKLRSNSSYGRIYVSAFIDILRVISTLFSSELEEC